MNGNVAAAHSGIQMPATNKHNLDLRLDLNLMNLNAGSTPVTPNGKIKVFMNNIASGVTKAKAASSEWRRCRLDSQNCISLAAVLETFNSSISEEQAWAICFGFVRCIRTLAKKGFKFKRGQLAESEFVLYLHRDGYVHEKTIIQLFNRSDESNDSLHETNGSANDSAIGSVNGSLSESNGTLNGTSNGTLNGTLNGVLNGSLNSPVKVTLNGNHELTNGLCNDLCNGATNGQPNGSTNDSISSQISDQIGDQIGNQISGSTNGQHVDEAGLANGVAKEQQEVCVFFFEFALPHPFHPVSDESLLALFCESHT